MLLFLIAAVVVVVMIGDMTVVVFVTAIVVVIGVVVVAVAVVVVAVPIVSDTNHLAECLVRSRPFQGNTSLPPPLLQSLALDLALVLVLSWRKGLSWL